MLSVRCSSALFLLVSLLVLAAPIEQSTGADPSEKTKADPEKTKADPAGKLNTVKKSLDGVVLFTAAIPQESPAAEPVRLSLQLKNLGKTLLVFNDSAFDTFLLEVKTKDGAVVRATRYLEELVKPAKGRAPHVERARDVDIELAPGKEAGVTLPLHQLFDLSLDAEYVISIEARFTVKGASGKVAIENLPFRIRHVAFGRITKVR